VARSDPCLSLWSPEHLRLALNAAGVALWSWDVDTDSLTIDELGFQLWSLPPRPDVRFEELSTRIHPADRDRVKAAFTATRAAAGAYEIDFRILVDDIVRWISARGHGNDAEMVERTMFGVFLDVTQRKQAEEGHELLAGEMSHRVKNLLAIATGLTNITSRTATTTADMARELTQRLTALGRAHDLVRPLPGHEGKAALLGDLFTVLLAPYDDVGAFSGRIRVALPRMGLGQSATTALALVIHELATNSVKYGSLSCETGTLDVSGSVDDVELSVVWTERGGPPVVNPEQSTGYGSRLLERILSRQLSGSVVCDWEADGAIVTVRMKKTALSV
jgi:two-component sensor histidine kinase